MSLKLLTVYKQDETACETSSQNKRVVSIFEFESIPYNMKWKALIIDDLHESFEKELSAHQVETTYRIDLNKSEIAEELKGYNILVLRSKIFVDAEFIESQPQLRIIARAGSGLDNIDLEAAEKQNIICVNAAEGNRVAVGEQSVGMLLSLAANISSAHKEVQNGEWNREKNRGWELEGKTIGIIGFGNTGSSVASRLSGFGMNILAYDKYKTGFGNSYVEEVDYDQILQEADIISFHVPLTSLTKHWIDSHFINSVRKNFVLLNLSRGHIMKTQDIIEALDSEKIKAFGSDVLENENLKSHNQLEIRQLESLAGRRNVVITPHIGGWTIESYRKISEVLANKLIETLKLNLVSTRKI